MRAVYKNVSHNPPKKIAAKAGVLLERAISIIWLPKGQDEPGSDHRRSSNRFKQLGSACQHSEVRV